MFDCVSSSVVLENSRFRRIGFGFILVCAATWSDAAPAPLEFESVVAATGESRLEGGGKGGSQAVTASLLMRRALPLRDWYWGGGFQAENYFFDRRAGVPRRLQDYAAVFTVEYYSGDELAASLTARPGWYFANRAVAKAWDVPVILASGVPLGRTLNGVIGFGNGRFYHHPLPILGLVWTAPPHLRIEAV